MQTLKVILFSSQSGRRTFSISIAPFWISSWSIVSGRCGIPSFLASAFIFDNEREFTKTKQRRITIDNKTSRVLFGTVIVLAISRLLLLATSSDVGLVVYHEYCNEFVNSWWGIMYIIYNCTDTERALLFGSVWNWN